MLAETGKQLQKHPYEIIQETIEIGQAPVWADARHVEKVCVDISTCVYKGNLEQPMKRS